MDALKSALVRGGLLSPSCADTYFVEKAFLDALCGKSLLSTVLSYVVLVGATAVKLPQIISIVANGAGGVSAMSVSMENIGFFIVIAHAVHERFKFSAYGENIFVVLQNLVISVLIASYSRTALDIFQAILSIIIGGFTAWRCFASIFMGELVMANVMLLQVLRGLCIFIFSFSRLPQIVSNFTNKSTGSLSFLTTFLQFAGGLARVFTTIADKDNWNVTVFVGFVAGTFLHFIVLAQILWYGSWQLKRDESNIMKHAAEQRSRLLSKKNE